MKESYRKDRRFLVARARWETEQRSICRGSRITCPPGGIARSTSTAFVRQNCIRLGRESAPFSLRYLYQPPECRLPQSDAMPTGTAIVSYLPALRVPSVVPTVDGEEAMSLTFFVRSALPA